MTGPAHHHEDHDHPLDRRAFLRVGGMGLGAMLIGACGSSAPPVGAPGSSTTAPPAPTTASATPTTGTGSPTEGLPGFDEFASTVRVLARGELWLVESNGMPSHNMMVGITSWQQQVPTPQSYTGANAWQIPAHPTLAAAPISARTSLYRGAIALAVNGVPIFNALNNRGDDAYLAGELDQWGGHSGRADDYHYHIAPLHLQIVVGTAKPIAYALDGFPLYGTTEPDGTPATGLDEYNGHLDAGGRYHYHGTLTYPYINGGLRGVVHVAGDQIDPQPVTRPFRADGTPLRGATITAFEATGPNAYRLEYSLAGRAGLVDYTITDTTVSFAFTDPTGPVRTETYTRTHP